MSEHQRQSPPPGKRGFEDLRFFQESLDLLRLSYDLIEQLPAAERYNLADQLRRASTRVVLSIPEGYGRYHFAEKLRFFYYARGSLDETLSCFIAAAVTGYCDEALVDEVRALVHSIHRGMNGYIAYIQRQRQGADIFGKSHLREPDIVYTAQPPKPDIEMNPDH